MLIESMPKILPNRPPENFPTNSIGFLLHDTARLLRKRFEQNARHLELTRSQWQVLTLLARNQGVRQNALAIEIDIEPITLGRIVYRLEHMGLVERRPDTTDRRAWLLYLNDKAHPLMADVAPVAAATREEALAGISENDRAALTRILETMRANLAGASGHAPDKPEKSRHP
jgi:MarR family transcriptional regulator, transcriptional regulator for hemolysin